MDTSSLAISQPRPVNPENVLFEPQIYRAPVEEDKQMEEDNVSVSTHAGANASMVSNYKTDLDPSLFAANKM